MNLADFPDVQALDAQRKLQLVEEIWASMAPDLAELPVTEREKEILDARWKDFEQEPSKALTVNEFRAKWNSRRRG